MRETPRYTVQELTDRGLLRVEDGNHGEYRPRKHEFVESGVAFIRAADLSDAGIDFAAAARINEVARARITKGIGQPKDVVLSHKGTVGKVAMAPRDAPPFVCSPQTTFWRSLGRETLDQEFLHAFVRSPDFRAQLDSRAGETDMAAYVSLTAQRTFWVPLPPIGVQNEIVSCISSIDRKIDLNRRMNETLEAMARAIFKDWFVDFGPTRAKAVGCTPYLAPELWDLFPDSLDDEGKPVGWEVSPLGERIEILDSKRIPLSSRERKVRQGPYPYHGATGVMDHVDDFLFEGVHVLLGEDGSVVRPNGKPFTQYVSGRFWANNHAHVLRGKGISNEMLLCFFQQLDIAPYVTGAVQQKLNQKNLKSIPFPASGTDTSAAFERVVAPLYEQFRRNSEGSHTLAQTRDLLLPKLMSGEIRLRDAEAVVAEVA